MSQLQIPAITIDELPVDARIIDVREDYEWNDGHVEGAIHAPMESVPNRVVHESGFLAPEERVYVICAMGGRSGQVTAWLVRNGYDAVNIAGGMNAWEQAGRPVVRETLR